MAQVSSIEFKSNKKQVDDELKDKLITWLDAIGDDAAGTAADKAPVDTGRLQNSISSAVVEDEMAVYIGTNVEYAIYQEFGTSRGVKGKHFLQFGASAHSGEYKQMLENVLKEE